MSDEKQKDPAWYLNCMDESEIRGECAAAIRENAKLKAELYTKDKESERDISIRTPPTKPFK